MSGFLNQATPFIATAGLTLFANQMFFGTRGFNNKTTADIEAINTEVAKQAELGKSLQQQLKIVAQELKKMKDASASQAKLTETATKNLQKQLEALKKDLSEGKKIVLDDFKKRDDEISAMKKNTEKFMTKHQSEFHTTLSRLENEVKKCAHTPEIVAEKKLFQKDIVSTPGSKVSPAVSLSPATAPPGGSVNHPDLEQYHREHPHHVAPAPAPAAAAAKTDEKKH